MADEVIAKLKRRDEERLEQVAKRRADTAKKSSENESKDTFELDFVESNLGIVKLMEESANIEKSALPEHFDLISSKIQTLTKYVGDSALFLPAFQLKTAQNGLNELSDALKLQRDSLLPKKKFAFKSRSKEKKKDVKDNNQLEVKDVTTTSKQDSAYERRPGFHNINGKCLKTDPGIPIGGDFCLSNLTGCTVHLDGVSTEIHMDVLTNCKVICRPVSRAVFLENCTNCTFVIACQQLRVHATQNCDFYLHVTSKGIIEDCKNVRVAPYCWEYDELAKDFSQAGLDRNCNNWNALDDFNWLKLDEKSPNWREINPSERWSCEDVCNSL